MKICFFANSGSLHAQRVVASLAQRGHEVCFVCHKAITIPGVTVEIFRVPNPSLRHPHRWEARKRNYLHSFLRRFDVVVWFFLHDWGFTPEIIEKGCFIATPRGSDIVCPPGEGPVPPELLERRIELLRHARSVSVAGPRFAHIVAEFAGLDEERIDRLPLGVDLTKFRPDGKGAVPQDDTLRVGFFKGFREVYGPRYLVEAIPQVLAEVPNARFDFVGDGPQRSLCEELAASLGVNDAVNWVSARPHDEVPQTLARWDLVIIPSLCESFGVAALESSAMGIPVVASNVGGLPDTVRDGETGILVPPKSSSALARAIVTLLRDPQRRKCMGEAGRAWVAKHFEWQSILDQWIATFQTALDRSPAFV